MGLTMREKKSVSREYARRYKSSSKKVKGIILDEYVKLTKYRRDYASFLLKNWGKKVYFDGGRVLFVGDFKSNRSNSGRKRKYCDATFRVLYSFWELLNYPCGKRLKPQLNDLIAKAVKFKEIEGINAVSSNLRSISAATIDRLLKPARKKFELKPRSKTKPGTLLKRDIPIRTGVDWDEDEFGYLEIDLVSHEGSNSSGDFCQTLNTVDIKSGWTDMVAVKNKAQIWVFEALKEIRDRLPFQLKGIDSDNGSEFINSHLFSYCQEQNIKFTRSRPHRKNDNCFVEQKNFTAVRSYVGYYRYDTKDQMDVLNTLYSQMRLYLNYFQPSMKLMSKTRKGTKITKKYDTAKTPYRRILIDNAIDEYQKTKLKSTYEDLNPFELKRKINILQNKLFRMAYLRKHGRYFDGKKIS